MFITPVEVPEGRRHVQVDHHAARAVGIDRVVALFSPFRCEFGRTAVAYVVTLCEVAVAVENLDTCHNCGMVKLVTPKAYSPLSVAFEQPKSSLPPARATPLSAGNAIAAASIPLKSQLVIFVLPSFGLSGCVIQIPIEPCWWRARYEAA